jgi:hypothetical protein
MKKKVNLNKKLINKSAMFISWTQKRNRKVDLNKNLDQTAYKLNKFNKKWIKKTAISLQIRKNNSNKKQRRQMKVPLLKKIKHKNNSLTYLN